MKSSETAIGSINGFENTGRLSAPIRWGIFRAMPSIDVHCYLFGFVHVCVSGKLFNIVADLLISN